MVTNGEKPNLRGKRYSAKMCGTRRLFGLHIYGLWNNEKNRWATIPGWEHVQTKGTVKAWARAANRGRIPTNTGRRHGW